MPRLCLLLFVDAVFSWLTTNGVETHAGLLFKEYYKQVFVKVDCGGKTKYFSKTKKDGGLAWVLLPKTPFGDKISKFYYYLW